MLDITDSERIESRETMIFRGTGYIRDEILLATKDLIERVRLIDAASKTLNDNFEAKKMVEIKLASESLAVAASNAVRILHQIEGLSSSLAGTFGVHVRRKG